MNLFHIKNIQKYILLHILEEKYTTYELSHIPELHIAISFVYENVLLFKKEKLNLKKKENLI